MTHADDAWAKHRNKSQTTSNADPCAGPTAFVNDHIAKIRALRASSAAQSPHSITGFFSGSSDPSVYAKIADLRHDADTVNDMLRAGGCTPIDIDHQIQLPGAAPAPPAITHKKRKKNY